MAAPKVHVKKVAPYPIEVQITQGEAQGQPPKTGQIVKMTEIGFIMMTDAAHYYKITEVYNFYFEFPVINQAINTSGIVVKTYDRMQVGGKDQVKSLMVEIHFKALSATDRALLNTYLVKSGQRK